MPQYLQDALPVYSGAPLEAASDFVAGANVSALTFKAQWRPRPDSAEFLDFAIDMTDAATGRIVIRLTGAQTKQMKGAGVFDVWITAGTAGAEGRPLAVGKTELTVGPTRV